MSNVYAFLKAQPVTRCEADFVEIRVSARDVILQFPTPAAGQRDPSLIPDVEIKFYLSTGLEHPAFIKKLIENTPDNTIFKDDTLMGLCFSGRGLPVEIFLHEPRLLEFDPSGNFFDEVLWHETVHGIEGIKRDKNNNLIRPEPWSYTLQQAMLRLDAENGSPEGMGEKEILDHPYMQYLRKGTVLQENVSEIFARVASLYVIEVREKGVALSLHNPEDLGDVDLDDFDNTNRRNSNLNDLFTALSTYGEKAQSVFWGVYPKTIETISSLYGFRPDKSSRFTLDQ